MAEHMVTVLLRCQLSRFQTLVLCSRFRARKFASVDQRPQYTSADVHMLQLFSSLYSVYLAEFYGVSYFAVRSLYGTRRFNGGRPAGRALQAVRQRGLRNRKPDG